jgi:hypothetical protein
MNHVEAGEGLAAQRPQTDPLLTAVDVARKTQCHYGLGVGPLVSTIAVSAGDSNERRGPIWATRCSSGLEKGGGPLQSAFPRYRKDVLPLPETEFEN